MSQGKPVAIFYAGTNGAGKSSLRQSEGRQDIRHIDPDLIAKSLNPNNPRSVDVAAGRLAIAEFKNVLNQRVSFSLETTLTGRSILQRMQEVKDAGFHTQLYYVGLHSPELNIARVDSRVARGGHAIEHDVILKRYEKSLGSLPTAVNIADKTEIYDNSTASFTPHVLIQDKVMSCITDQPQPLWISHACKRVEAELFQMPSARTNDFQHIQKAGKSQDLIIRNAHDLQRNYRGYVVTASSQHLLLKISPNIAVCYEKAHLDRQVHLGERIAIQYAHDKSQVLERLTVPDKYLSK